MAINKAMLSLLKAISYVDIDVKKNYKVNRLATKVLHPSIKLLYQMWDHKVVAKDGYEIPVRIFLPKQSRTNDVILYFHGGGWVTGDIESYSQTCSTLADTTGRRVVSVDYRLAPEYPFPYAPEDCYLVTRELFLNKGLLHTENSDIILMGDSAGGNLAAVVSLMAADRGEFLVQKQVLIYPSTYHDHTLNAKFPSIRENGTDYLLTSKRICDYMELYIQNPQDLQNPYFAPLLRENLSGQPKTLVITAEFDPLRDEGEAYGKKLRAFGNEVEIHRIPDSLHGFFTLPLKFTAVEDCYQKINDFLDGAIYEK